VLQTSTDVSDRY